MMLLCNKMLHFCRQLIEIFLSINLKKTIYLNWNEIINVFNVLFKNMLDLCLRNINYKAI